ncbi:flavin reductase [Lachnospiraceae bacterium MD308]|nr:flavin reductase [Lachnospiraceae bacterium MD308]MCI8579263.1 flavin reductase [Dorea sp.]
MNKNVFRNLSYGVYVVSTLDGKRNTGCVANSIMQITSSPASVAVSMNHDNYTNSCIQNTGKFAVSILSELSAPSLIGQFGFQSGKDTDKFDGIDFSVREGLPVLNDCCGYLVCKVIDKMETSSHTVFLGEVIDGDTIGGAPAMTYAYYHNVVKGKSPKNAPTYIAEEDRSAKDKTASKWACQICGYVYEGEVPFEELPDTFVCPVCRQSKDKFAQK